MSEEDQRTQQSEVGGCFLCMDRTSLQENQSEADRAERGAHILARIVVADLASSQVFAGTILQQMFIVEFVVQNEFCPACHRVQAKDTWQAVVQVRQKVRPHQRASVGLILHQVEHKRTFFHLEQLILKHKAHNTATNIKETADGLDFFYSHRSHAMKMIDFLQTVVPIRY